MTEHTLRVNDMLQSEINSFRELERKCNVIFYYSGLFSQNIVAAMAEALKQRLAHSGNKAATQRKVFSTFIEMAQNVIHYSADTFSDVDQQDDELRHGAVWIGESDNKFFIVCGNPVDINQVARMRHKLDALQTMSQEEIKAAYKTQLRNETEATSKGAGLGFLTVARDASEPIEFHFDDQPDGKTAMFYLKAKF